MEHYRGVPSKWVSRIHGSSSLTAVQLGLNIIHRSFDGKVKVWSIDTKTCVATHSETDKALWSVKWIPKVGKSEGFATAGANRSIAFYREATGVKPLAFFGKCTYENIWSETSVISKKKQRFSLSSYVNVVICGYYFPSLRHSRSL